MKKLLLSVILFAGTKVFAQSKDADEIIALSKQFFQWEIRNSADSVAQMLDEHFIGVTSAGIRRNKAEYLANFKNPGFIHNGINIEETRVNVFGNTAILTGKGLFTITANNVQSTLHLFFMETYMKTNQGWKMIALQGGHFPDK